MSGCGCDNRGGARSRSGGHLSGNDMSLALGRGADYLDEVSHAQSLGVGRTRPCGAVARCAVGVPGGIAPSRAGELLQHAVASRSRSAANTAASSSIDIRGIDITDLVLVVAVLQHIANQNLGRARLRLYGRERDSVRGRERAYLGGVGGRRGGHLQDGEAALACSPSFA